MTSPAAFEGLDESPLARSPIVTALWQLRCEEHQELVSAQTALKLQQHLGGPTEFNLMQLPKVMLSVRAVNSGLPQGISTPPVDAGGGGWRLSAVDATWHLNIEASSISIESSTYGTWSKDFAPRIERVLEALGKVCPPVIETRLGLRYVNILVGSAVQGPPFKTPCDIHDLVSPWLLGPLAEPSLQGNVQMARGNIIFKFDGINAILNHGIVSTENNELGYLLDVDAAREGGRPYDAEEIQAQSSKLHEVTLGLFQAAVTPEALNLMRQ